MRRARRACLVALLAAAACSRGETGAGEPGGDPGARARGVLRLWRDLAPVSESHPEPAPGPGEPLLVSRLDGTATSWWRPVPRGGAVRYEPLEPPPSGEALRLAPASGEAAVAFLDVRPGAALRLEVRARGIGRPPDGETVVAAVFEHDRPVDPSRELPAGEVERLIDEQAVPRHELTLAVTERARAARGTVLLGPRTRQVAVTLLAPSARSPTLAFEDVRVWQRGLTDLLARGGRVAGLSRLPARVPGTPGRAADGSDTLAASTPSGVRARLDRDEREGLLALAPSRFEYLLPPHAGARVLDLSLGLRPRAASVPGAVRVLVEAAPAEGARATVLLDETRRAPGGPAEPAWTDRTLTLPPSPRAPLRLVLATEAVGDDPPVAVLGHPTVRAVGRDDRPPIVLVSLDTVRADRLGCYGGDPAISTHIDALAADGLLFTQAESVSSYTLPSHASIMTGQFPALHGATDVTDALDTDHSPLLARTLARAGYVTAAFTGGGYVNAHFGFAQGFDRYAMNDPVLAYDTLRGRQILDKRDAVGELDRLRRYRASTVADWIARQPDGSPYLLFLHTYVAHNYAPSREWLERLGLPAKEGEQEPLRPAARNAFNRGDRSRHDEVSDAYVPYYDATIGMADAFVGRVVAALEEAGRYDDAMIVVTSDHGEELGEHGYFGHGRSVYRANTHVPLIVKLPAGRALTGVVDEPVSLVDVAPWILDVAGLEPDPRMGVRTALGPDALAPPRRELLFVEVDTHKHRVSAVRRGDHRLHVVLEHDDAPVDEEVVRLFDVSRDPAETEDLAARRPRLVAELRDLLDRFHELTGAARPGADPDAPIDPELRHELEALGYVLDGTR